MLIASPRQGEGLRRSEAGGARREAGPPKFIELVKSGRSDNMQSRLFAAIRNLGHVVPRRRSGLHICSGRAFCG
jgi:hypothetical protein